MVLANSNSLRILSFDSNNNLSSKRSQKSNRSQPFGKHYYAIFEFCPILISSAQVAVTTHKVYDHVWQTERNLELGRKYIVTARIDGAITI